MSKFKVGDKVKITGGTREGWVRAMEKCIGSRGEIVAATSWGDFLVSIDDQIGSWWFYPDSFVTNKFKGNK